MKKNRDISRHASRRARLLVILPTAVAAALLFAVTTIMPVQVLAEEGAGERYLEAGKGSPYVVKIREVFSGLWQGRIELFITVVNRETNKSVPDAQIALHTKYISHGAAEPAQTTYYSSTSGYFEIDLELGAPGSWTMALEISSSLGEWEGTLAPVEVPALRRIDVTISLIVLGILGLLGGTIYVWRKYGIPHARATEQ